MAPETIDIEIYLYLLAWLVIPVALFLLHARRGGLGGFLVYSYLLGFIINHWFGALAHASPWSPFIDSTDTIVGFRLSTYGLFALALGTLIADATQHLPVMERRLRNIVGRRVQLVELDRLARVFFLPIGVGSWIATYTPLAQLPSMGAVLSTGKQCTLMVFCLICWSAWHQGDKKRFNTWIGISGILPVITIISSGFIGYGIIMVTTILAFVAMFYRPRWRLLAGLLLMMYGGLGFWVSYAKHRAEIREAVWGGQGLGARFDAFGKSITSYELFDLADPAHLEAVDLRLNQNWLVGVTIRTTPSLVPFRNGETIIGALASVIPRAIWPDKPGVGGSGTYVSEHTMIEFAGNTSVGMGQVLEFYINFGTTGVIIGMLVLGFALRFMDMRLAAALVRSDWDTVMFYFLVGSATLQVGGSLAEIGAGVAAAVAVSFAASHVLKNIQKPHTKAGAGRRRVV